MKHLMRSMQRLGSKAMKNKGKVLLGLAAIALAPALRWAMQRYGLLKAEMAPEEEETEETPSPPKPRRNKREIYQAPKVPPQNLVRH
ncbi:MAG TPA: hypothetical protein VJR29_14245 [bacterium]|nr:hypothetical protein [bacterium]